MQIGIPNDLYYIKIGTYVNILCQLNCEWWINSFKWKVCLKHIWWKNVLWDWVLSLLKICWNVWGKNYMIDYLFWKFNTWATCQNNLKANKKYFKAKFEKDDKGSICLYWIWRVFTWFKATLLQQWHPASKDAERYSFFTVHGPFPPLNNVIPDNA